MLTLQTLAIVTKINRKSNSPCFKDLEIGDIIEFSTPIQHVGTTSRHRTRPTYILCHNKRTQINSELSFNQIDKVLSCCELEEIKNP